MSRIFLFLSTHATITENKLFTKKVCEAELENFKYFIQKFPHNSLAKQIDEKTCLDKFLSNIRQGYTAKLVLGNVGSGHPMIIEGFIDGVFIPKKTEERMLNWFCPWTSNNYERINDLFIDVYHKPIFSFPRNK
jgi:hypothetical protein